MAARKKASTKKRTSAKKTTAKRKSPARAKTTRAKTTRAKTTRAKATRAKTTRAKTTRAKTTRKTVKRTTKRAAPKLSLVKGSVNVGRKPFTKSQFIAEICERTGSARKEVVAMMDTISQIINAHLKRNGPGAFSWPGLMKMKVVKKPATKARPGINPFTGESIMIKAKPASRKVKILALKQLKEMAN